VSLALSSRLMEGRKVSFSGLDVRRFCPYFPVISAILRQRFSVLSPVLSQPGFVIIRDAGILDCGNVWHLTVGEGNRS
jgi:hypothetical protein